MERLEEFRVRVLQGCSSESSSRSRQPLADNLACAHRVLTEGLEERDSEAWLLLLAALAGEHLLLVGSPGTAKSLLARRLAEVCDGRFFERLLTKFSVPEEIFGPLSLKALERDEFTRKTIGFLPSAVVAFLDEVFKANSSILNSLLVILNEREFDNGGIRERVPLLTVVAASNELPEGDDELRALYDRFLLRRVVPPVSDEAVIRLLKNALAPWSSCPVADRHRLALISATEAAHARRQARSQVQYPRYLIDVIAELRMFLRDRAPAPFLVSDRRLAKAVALQRVAAYADGCDSVGELHMLLLQHMMWGCDPTLSQEVREWLLERLTQVESSCGHTASGLQLLVDAARGLLVAKATGREARSNLDSLRAKLQERLRGQLRLRERWRLQLEASNSIGWPLWFEKRELKQVAETVLPKLKSGIVETESVLQQVLELDSVAELEDDALRRGCLEMEALKFGRPSDEGYGAASPWQPQS